MKTLSEYINPVNEGWVGGEGDKAYDKILNVWKEWEPEQILTLIWNYFSSDDLKNLYKWMEQDDYFD